MKSWLPWSAIEQIPQGMALELTPWMNGRKPESVYMTLRGHSSRLRNIKYAHLRVILRNPVVLIWYPSKQAVEALAKDALTDGRKK